MYKFVPSIFVPYTFAVLQHEKVWPPDKFLAILLNVFGSKIENVRIREKKSFDQNIIFNIVIYYVEI